MVGHPDHGVLLQYRNGVAVARILITPRETSLDSTIWPGRTKAVSCRLDCSFPSTELG
jgi:hypothetical protein